MQLKDKIIEEYNRVVCHYGREKIGIFYRNMGNYYGYSKNQCYRIKDGIDNGLDINYYLDIRLDEPKMSVIYMGLKEGRDVTLYNSYQYELRQMYLILRGLREDLDVEKFNNINYNYELMYKIYEKLKSRKYYENYINNIDSEILLLIMEN